MTSAPLPPSCPRCGHVLTAAPPPLPPPPTPIAPAPSITATTLPRYPAPPAAPRPPAPSLGTRLSSASVPRILLGLGALCLLVAAVIFLAVAWSWLGLTGRTSVLVALTAASGLIGRLVVRRGLRVTAEALTGLALGLLVVDVFGAASAGWLGDPSVQQLGAVLGGTLLAASLALSLPRARLLAPQVAAPIGLTLLLATLDLSFDSAMALGLTATLAFLALAAAGRLLRAGLLAWLALIGAAIAYAVLLASAVEDATDHPSLQGLWLEGHGLWLVAAAAFPAAACVLLDRRRDQLSDQRQVAAAGAASILTLLAVVPVLDEGRTAITLAAMATALAWAGATRVAPARWSGVPVVPLLAALLATLPVPAVLLARAGWTLLEVGAPWTTSTGVRLQPGPSLAPSWLLPLAALTVVVAVALAGPRLRLPRPAPVSAPAAALALLAVAGVGAAALHPLPLAVFVALPAVAAAGLVTRRPSAALVVVAVALLLAVPSAALSALALAEVVAGTALLLLRRVREVRTAAGAVLPAAAAGLVWSLGHLAGTPFDHRSLVVVAVLGLLAAALPRPEVETAAWAGALVAGPLGIPEAADVSVSLAVHLTLAGALVTASALVHLDRRRLAWAGGLLLAAATWVRLADLGVHAPEPYTLPAAAALVLLGLERLRRDRSLDTLPLLLPGLALATVPSLLWVLVDPLSTRAVVLGLACLALLLAGAGLRWTAPVVVGAAVGGLVVLRELAPYAAQTPQWLLIGAAGTVLVGVGVSWEARLRDLRQAAGYLGALR